MASSTTRWVYVEDQGTAGYCSSGLNLYKVIANRAIGTGPNFADSAALGVPGFNEFYYLRNYPDAAAAVQAGQYRSGLEHYRAVGQALGYRGHAPNSPLDAQLKQTPVPDRRR